MFDNIGKSTREDISSEDTVSPDLKVFLTGVINSLHEHVAVVDRTGRIIAVNEAWKDFARRNDAGSSLILSSGINYLQVCRSVSGEDSDYASGALKGIEDVMGGRRDIFEMEYTCSSPEKERWFLMTVVPLRRPEGGVVVTHANITRRKKAEEKLRSNEAYLKESREEYQALSRKLIAAREGARRRLARELHDSFSQRLAMVSMLAARMEIDNKGKEKVLEGLKRIKTEISKLSEDVHDIARQLHPRILEDLGLKHAVESLCESYSRSERIPIGLNIGKIPDNIPEESALNLYRIIQESISNVVKHAHAENIWVKLNAGGGRIYLSIKDDGAGFDPGKVKSKKRLGLVGMRERAALIGGEIAIASEPGAGTEISVEVPLKD